MNKSFCLVGVDLKPRYKELPLNDGPIEEKRKIIREHKGSLGHIDSHVASAPRHNVLSDFLFSVNGYS